MVKSIALRDEKESKQEPYQNELMRKRLENALSEIAFAEATDFTKAGAPVYENAVYKGSSKLKALELLLRLNGAFAGDENEAEQPVVIIDDL